MREQAYAQMPTRPGYRAILVDAGPHPTMDATGRVDYGQPIPRVTWRRNLPAPTPQTCKVFKPPYKHHSAQVHG